MKTLNIRRFAAILLCVTMVLTSLNVPAFAEEAEAPSCAHNSTVIRKEAGTAATCTAEGSHTEITVCADCGTELSRKTVTDPAL